jgi:hypothetical protein
LFVSGGSGGNARVVNAFTGEIVASYAFVTPVPGANNTFINDVVLTPQGPYFTDSRSPVLFHLPLGRDGRLPAQDEVQTVQLSGDWAANAAGVMPSSNGLTRTPDGPGPHHGGVQLRHAVPGRPGHRRGDADRPRAARPWSTATACCWWGTRSTWCRTGSTRSR